MRCKQDREAEYKLKNKCKEVVDGNRKMEAEDRADAMETVLGTGRPAEPV